MLHPYRQMVITLCMYIAVYLHSILIAADDKKTILITSYSM